MIQKMLEVRNDERTERGYVRGLYIAHVLSMLVSLGVLSLFIVIFNYLKRQDVEGTYLASHHTWMIQSFFGFLLFWVAAILIGLPLLTLPFAVLLVMIGWFWKAYRLIKGWIALDKSATMPVWSPKKRS